MEELEEEENERRAQNHSTPYFEESDSDLSEEEIRNSDHSSETEVEGSNGEDDRETTAEEFYIGKDKVTKWCKSSLSKSSKTKKKNIVKILPGPRRVVRDSVSPADVFLKLIDVNMIDEILLHTNSKIEKLRTRYSRPRDCTDLTREELLATIGILIQIGLKKGRVVNVEELWAKDGTGMMLLRAAMSYRRFLLILRSLRFDDSTNRQERRKLDKLAAIRYIFDRFVQNIRKCYSMSELVTIDEMLHPFRGRCSWIQYMPSKPAKYGMKMYAMADAKTFYCGNLEVYVGKQPAGPYSVSNSPEEVVKRLVEDIVSTNRNVTTDNWYTSMSLATYLISKGITLLGTMRKNKAVIPPEFLPNKNRAVGSSIFGYQKDRTLVSYVTRKNKAVILMSTMHDSGDIDLETGKPHIILDYNGTKGGVDTLDKLCATYSVSRTTRRWPLSIFFSLINIAGVNAQVLYLMLKENERPILRRNFLKLLSLELMKEHMYSRSKITCLPIDLKAFLQLQYPQSSTSASSSPQKKKMRGTCTLCGRSKNSSTTMMCSMCSHFVCKNHSSKNIVCNNCQ